MLLPTREGRLADTCFSESRIPNPESRIPAMQLRSDNFADGQPIPAANAFGKPGAPVALSDNRSPHLAWRDAPEGTRSFVLTCIDVDVPSRGDDVNKEGRVVPADLPRVEFVHWLMA